MNVLLTVSDAAQLLKVSKSTIYKYCEQYRIPFIRKSFGLRFKSSDLAKWMEQDSRSPLLANEFMIKALTSQPPFYNYESKGGKSKLAKKGQTCFNYGYGLSLIHI